MSNFCFRFGAGAVGSAARKRRGGRVVERAALEMRFRLNPNVGSNPTPSATSIFLRTERPIIQIGASR